jgi:hypothetical protein
MSIDTWLMILFLTVAAACGRAVRIYHADWLNPGLRFICQGCHIDLLSFEQTQWHRAEVHYYEVQRTRRRPACRVGRGLDGGRQAAGHAGSHHRRLRQGLLFRRQPARGDRAFPDYRRVIPKATGHAAVCDRAEIIAAPGRLAAVAAGEVPPLVALVWDDAGPLRVFLPRQPDDGADVIAGQTRGAAKINSAVATRGTARRVRGDGHRHRDRRSRPVNPRGRQACRADGLCLARPLKRRTRALSLPPSEMKRTSQTPPKEQRL